MADQHEYLLRHQFRRLMEYYHMTDSDIIIDHKREELSITVSLQIFQYKMNNFCTFTLPILDEEKFEKSCRIIGRRTINIDALLSTCTLESNLSTISITR
jgi:hypothetical protein